MPQYLQTLSVPGCCLGLWLPDYFFDISTLAETLDLAFQQISVLMICTHTLAGLGVVRLFVVKKETLGREDGCCIHPVSEGELVEGIVGPKFLMLV